MVGFYIGRYKSDPLSARTQRCCCAGHELSAAHNIFVQSNIFLRLRPASSLRPRLWNACATPRVGVSGCSTPSVPLPRLYNWHLKLLWSHSTRLNSHISMVVQSLVFKIFLRMLCKLEARGRYMFKPRSGMNDVRC